MSKMVLNPFCDETLLEPQLAHARHLGYHTQHHNNLHFICHLGSLCIAAVTPFRDASVTWCDTPFSVHF